MTLGEQFSRIGSVGERLYASHSESENHSRLDVENARSLEEWRGLPEVPLAVGT